MSRGRGLEFALLAGLAALATVLARTAVVLDREAAKGPLVAGALLGWPWLRRRARAWLDDSVEDDGR